MWSCQMCVVWWHKIVKRKRARCWPPAPPRVLVTCLPSMERAVRVVVAWTTASDPARVDDAYLLLERVGVVFG